MSSSYFEISVVFHVQALSQFGLGETKRLMKLKVIREHLGMTPDQLAAFVGAKNGAEILAFENDEDDLLVSA